jgi:hypothetical protein
MLTEVHRGEKPGNEVVVGRKGIGRPVVDEWRCGRRVARNAQVGTDDHRFLVRPARPIMAGELSRRGRGRSVNGRHACALQAAPRVTHDDMNETTGVASAKSDQTGTNQTTVAGRPSSSGRGSTFRRAPSPTVGPCS